MARSFYTNILMQGGATVQGLPTPSAGTDAASKAYVDNAIAGLNWKDNVRAATTGNGTLATAYANGQVIDGITLATNDRILLRAQTTPAENGIYTVNASGAPTRSTDADAAAELVSAVVQVDEGTTLHDTIWLMTTNAPITVGSTSLSWTQLNIAGYSAGNGITLTGSVFSATAGTGITVTGGGINVDPAVVVKKFAATFGDGSSVSYNIDHNLATLDTVVQVYQVSDGTEIICDITRPPGNNNRVTLGFSVAPTTNQFRAVVHG